MFKLIMQTLFYIFYKIDGYVMTIEDIEKEYNEFVEDMEKENE